MKIRSVIKYFLIFFLFFGMGCDEIMQDEPFTIEKESTFQINRLYTSTDGQYTLLITEINDSRCLEGAQCGWQGEIRLTGEWTANQSKSTFELHSVLTNQQKQPDGFTIQIIDAKPYPKVGMETKAEDLMITLLIQRK